MILIKENKQICFVFKEISQLIFSNVSNYFWNKFKKKQKELNTPNNIINLFVNPPSALARHSSISIYDVTVPQAHFLYLPSVKNIKSWRHFWCKTRPETMTRPFSFCPREERWQQFVHQTIHELLGNQIPWTQYKYWFISHYFLDFVSQFAKIIIVFKGGVKVAILA